MSTTCYAWTLMVDDSCMPVDGFEVRALLQRADQSDAQLSSASRSDWHMRTLLSLVRQAGMEALYFLDPHGARSGRDPDGYLWSWVTVPAEGLVNAHRDADRLLSLGRSTPSFFASLHGTENDVRQGMEHPGEVDGDDGQGWAYFFAHLLALRALLERAVESGAGVLQVSFPHDLQ